MKKSILVLILALALLLTACSDKSDLDDSSNEANVSVESTDSYQPAEPSGPIEVELEAVANENGGMPIFTINTNLPDETNLMLSLSNSAGFMAQTHVIIANGTATSEPFSNQSNPLSGEYTLSVTMSLPRLQSDNVRAVIGENGEKITGQYVEKAEMSDANIIKSEFNFDFVENTQSAAQNNDSSDNTVLMSLDSLASTFEVMLSENYTGCTAATDESGINVNVWVDGVAMAVASIQASGGGADHPEWVTAKNGTLAMAKSLRETMNVAGHTDALLVVNVLNDQDTNKTLLSILNDTIIYDVLA